MFYVYIIHSAKFDKYYIGHTDNIENRLWSHNNSARITYTSKFRPWDLVVCFEAGESRKSAIFFEREIKKIKNKEVIRRIIEGELPESLAQLVRVPNKIL